MSDVRNYYIERLSIISNVAKSFDILATSVLHNYFDDLTKFYFQI